MGANPSLEDLDTCVNWSNLPAKTKNSRILDLLSLLSGRRSPAMAVRNFIALALLFISSSTGFHLPKIPTLSSGSLLKNTWHACTRRTTGQALLSCPQRRASLFHVSMTNSRGVSNMEEEEDDGMPAVLLAELDTGIRLNDLLLVQDLLKVSDGSAFGSIRVFCCREKISLTVATT
jgi:hypothetical protein